MLTVVLSTCRDNHVQPLSQSVNGSTLFEGLGTRPDHCDRFSVFLRLQEIETLEAAIDSLREERQALKKEFDEQVREMVVHVGCLVKGLCER